MFHLFSMNKKIILSGIAVLLFACQPQNNLDKQKAKLDKLKKQQTELAEKIKTLEQEIASQDTSQKNSKVVDVGVTPVTLQPFSSFVEIQGRIDADQNVTISPQTPGIVKSIYAREGDVVTVGQVLAELDDAVLRQSVEEVKTALTLATDLYNKQKNLWDQKIGSEIQYLTAKTNKESMEDRLKTLNQQLDMYKIKSPINGTVDEVDLKLGQPSAPGAPAFRIVNLNSLKAKADVSETYAGKIREGNDVIVFLPDINKEINSKISFVGKTISTMNRTFGVLVNLQSSPDYHPNMIAILKIVDYKTDNAIVLPINVVQNSEDGNYVFVAVGEGNNITAHKQIIKLGRSYYGNVEVTDGLKEGDRVITAGYQDVEDGEFLKLK